MTPQERQLIDDLFDRLAKLENAPRDPEALAAISEGLRKAPNAVYALVQTALVQDEALKRANDHIQQLEAELGGGPQQQGQGGGFLDSMRDAIFGQNQNQPRGSVPPVRPPEGGSRPAWNTGQAMQQAQGPGSYGQPPYGQQPQSYGAPQAGPFGGGGGSFLGTAAAAAAGVVGGSLLMNSIRGLMGGGGGHQAFGDSGNLGDNKPWGNDQSGGNLARDAGVNDIGSGGRDNDSRAGLYDQASNNNNNNNNDNNNNDDGYGPDDDDDGFDDGGDDGGSDYA
ncbi:DUF2076 domain-containing protein [Bradyrhizobium sp. Leo170]|uniref:DUF2076 domain-containing protein n=1 Tax=Bradyrhizobium sp. Leo170 TaxID=1571199 RepID=UPI00102E80B8|nr:DUF2076 domain-containing protein [Bradyrhizobium sp. Leo170]TAI61868.1 DUF2076 domain-containing protein [Bradyrhizobium sp. Leo170]